MPWTLCTSGAALAKAGFNATVSGALLAEWSTEAEGAICFIGRYDYVTNYGSITTAFKGALNDCTSDLIGMKIINYNTDAYKSSLEVQTRLDFLRDNAIRLLDVLKDDKNKETAGI